MKAWQREPTYIINELQVVRHVEDVDFAGVRPRGYDAGLVGARLSINTKDVTAQSYTDTVDAADMLDALV